MAARVTACKRLAAVSKALLAPSTQTGAIPVVPARHSSFRTSQFTESVVERPRYESFARPAEWAFVEELLRPRTVPRPEPRADYPSGWRPQSADALEKPYYVGRSRNHMPSAYLRIEHRGTRRITVMKRISGDVWRLREELIAHLIEKRGVRIASRVQEMAGKIEIKGDHYYDVRQFLLDKGM